MSRTAAAVVLALMAVSLCRGEEPNARWSFLRTNLQVFPGTEKIFQPDPHLFWKLKPNLAGVQAAEKLPGREYRFSVSTDGAARRRTPESPLDAPEILFLGDSCTFGIPVDDDESFPSVAGQLLGARAINAGVPGYSAFQGRVLMEKLEASPRAVVITFWVNGRTSWDHLSDAEHLELLAAERAGELSRHRVTRLLRRMTPGSRPRLSEEEFADELRKTVALARDRGARPLLAVWPSQRQMSGEEADPRQRIVATVGAETGVPVVELADRFRVSGGLRLFVDPVHATAKGYRIAGEAVAEALRPLLGDR